MDKKKIELIIAGVLALIFFVAIANAIGTIKKSRQRLKKPGAEKQVQAGSLPEVSPAMPGFGTSQESTEDIKASRWKNDPFNYAREIVPAGISEKNLVLKGIIWDETQPYAIINGRVVKHGDKIGAIEILEIKKRSVVISDNGGQEEIFLLEQ